MIKGRIMTICKDKNSIKYFVLASVILLCLYTNSLAGLFSPIFDNIYYGNLVNMFVAVVSAIIWGIEVGVIVWICKKFNIQIFTSKQDNKKELKTWQVIILFIITILPMIVISLILNWQVKIVYDLGQRVTIITLLCNVAQILAYAVRMVLMLMFIASVQKGCEMIFKTKFVIPYGAIFAILTFGLIDFFVLAVDLKVFYFIMSFWYGIIYVFADRKFLNTWIMCYLIYLL